MLSFFLICYLSPKMDKKKKLFFIIEMDKSCQPGTVLL